MWTGILKRLLRAMLREGALTVTFPDGSVHSFGDGSGTPVRMVIHDPRLVGRLVRAPDMAMGEGYMAMSGARTRRPTRRGSWITISTGVPEPSPKL